MMDWKEIGIVLVFLLVSAFAIVGLCGVLISASCINNTSGSTCQYGETYDFFSLPNLGIIILILTIVLTEIFFIAIKKWNAMEDDNFVSIKALCIVGALCDAAGICFTYYLFTKHGDVFFNGLTVAGALILVALWFISNYYIGKKIDAPRLAKEEAANQEYLKRVKAKERAVKRRRLAARKARQKR